MPKHHGVLLQAFQWHCPPDGTHWKSLAKQADYLRSLGFTSVWLPPANKAAGGREDAGYGVYDLWDLGEFDQKGTVPTKYGTKQEYAALVKAMHDAGLHVYADIVLNHRLGADAEQPVRGRRVNHDDRTQVADEASEHPSWCVFNFEARGGKYSPLKLEAKHFTAVEARFGEDDAGILLVDGKSFSDQVSNENGNYDYLLGCDVDVNDPEVRDDLMKWGEWIVETTGIDGFRLDAVKHMPASFFHDWLGHVRSKFPQRELFAVAEYWKKDSDELMGYFDAIDRDMSLFDVSLHYHFCEAAKQGRDYDLRKIYDGSLVQKHPIRAVTFVDNHDTEPGQSLESWVDDWFKPLAYAIILLRREGYPCVFHGDLYGLCNDDRGAVHRQTIETMLKLRMTLGHGEQIEAFNDPNCIGWGRVSEDGKTAAVVALNNADGCSIEMTLPVGSRKFRDVIHNQPDEVTTDESGKGTFPCAPGAVSVWVSEG